GALLILFPYRRPNPHSSSSELAGGTAWPARILAALAAGLIAAFAGYVVGVQQFFGVPPPQISHRALPVSIARLALFPYLALKEFPHVSLLPRWRDMTVLDLLGRVGLLAALFGLLWVAHRLLQPFFSTRPLVPQHSLLLVRLICAYSVAKPLVFLLTQVLFY